MRTVFHGDGSGDAQPLVSCIMPTRNRRAFVALALDWFEHQNYPNRELIVVDDGEDRVDDLTQGAAGNVHYVRTTATSLGAKRNLAARVARGSIIAHWDDDDWYGPDRLERQVAPILAGRGDLTGLYDTVSVNLSTRDFWRCRPELYRRLFAGDVHGGTLVYRRQILNEGLRYPAVNLAEDAAFLRSAMIHGKRLVRVAGEGVFVYARHQANAWHDFRVGETIDPDGWLRIGQPEWFPEGALHRLVAAVEIEARGQDLRHGTTPPNARPPAVAT